jgi:cell division protein FtsW (lipid II flippase)
MFFYGFVLFYTQSQVLMLQYHISTTKHSTVHLFIWCVLLCVCCILHTITSTNVTISHINNQTFHRSLVYTVCSFVLVVFYTQPLVLKIQYHIPMTKHSTVPLFIRYLLLCVPCILHTNSCTKATI